MWYALFDFQYTKKELMNNPEHYRLGLTSNQFGYGVFWKWIFYALYQGILVLIICFVFNQIYTAAEVPSGKDFNFWAAGNWVYGACVFLVNLVLLKMHNNFTGWGEAIMAS